MTKRPHECWGMTITLVITLGIGSATESLAQSSPQYRIHGGLGSGGGRASGSGRSLVGESGVGASVARSSSSSADVIGGFIGLAYAPRTRVTMTSEGEEFLSVAFPLAPSSRHVISVLDELGTPDLTRWRLGHWSARDSHYVEAQTGSLKDVERGHGYFLITADSVVIAQEGLTAPIEDYSIELEDGPGGRPAYNQLGNPFHFPISVGDLLVTDGTTTAPLVSPENELTEAVVKVYDAETGSYDSNADVIEAMTAFWVKKLAPGPVRVIAPYAAAGEEEGEASVKPKDAQWAISVVARQGRRVSEPLVVGAAAVRDGRWNSLCQSGAPDPPGGALALSLREEAWGRLSGDYVRVFRPQSAATSWDLNARGAELPGEVSLRFELFDLPADARVSVSDPDRSWSQPVAHGQTITIPSRRDQRLRLSVESAAAPQSAISYADGFRSVYPHPFRQRSGLVFTVSRPGALEARIYDVSGRCIRVLTTFVTEPGERVLVWDGTNHSGRSVPPGVYLAQYRIGQVKGVARLVKVE